MKRTTPVILLAALFAFTGSFVADVLSKRALASRNSSGTYSLPSGNPVTTGTTISSTWANNTLSDIGTELTNSLDRSGRGAMTGALQCSSGTISAPGLTFSADPVSGLYRAASHDIRMSVNGTDSMDWLSSGVTVPGTLGVSGTVSGATDFVVDSAGTNGGLISGAGSKVLRFGYTGSGEGIGSKRTSGGNQFGLDFYTNNLAAMSITNGGGVKIPGATASSPGSAITGSYAASYSVTYGALTANTCVSGSQTLTGVTAGGLCTIGVEGMGNAGAVRCAVSGTDAISITLCPNVSATFGTLTYRVRVWQP